jgi:hypothetical protein
MTTVQKFAGGLILIGVITALVLPGRQTVPVIGAATGLIRGSESTAITGQA